MPLKGKGPAVVAVLFGESLISGLFIGTKWYTRRYIRGAIGADDYVLWVTWILQTVFACFLLVSSMYGFGQHNTNLDPYNIMMATKIELMGQFVVSSAMGLSKTAVALLLLRILTTVWHKIILWVWIFSMMFLSILLSITCFAQCTPVESLWNPDVAAISCPINLTQVAFVMCSWSAAMDFFLALFPWYVLRGLNMKRKEKITICLSLSLGVFAGVCGIVRTSGLAVLSETSDYLYATADSVMWTSSELCITIICVCIPALRPLWQRLRGDESTDPQYQKSNARYGTNSKSQHGRNNAHFENDGFANSHPLETMNRVEIDGGAVNANWDEGDDKSDKSILDKPDGIVKKQEISVVYSSKK